MKVDFYHDVLITGTKNGLNATWMLAKVMVPVFFAVTFMKATPVIDWIASLMTPLMSIMGLPGEASIPLVLGNVAGLYAGIGSIKAIGFSAKEITIIAIMLSFSHALPLETMVTRKIGVKSFPVLATRISAAVTSGIIFNLFL